MWPLSKILLKRTDTHKGHLSIITSITLLGDTCSWEHLFWPVWCKTTSQSQCPQSWYRKTSHTVQTFDEYEPVNHNVQIADAGEPVNYIFQTFDAWEPVNHNVQIFAAWEPVNHTVQTYVAEPVNHTIQIFDAEKPVSHTVQNFVTKEAYLWFISFSQGLHLGFQFLQLSLIFLFGFIKCWY